MNNKIKNLFKYELPSLQDLIEEKNGTKLPIKIAYANLHSKESYTLNGDVPGWAASMIKVPVMVAAFRKIDSRELSFEERLTINHKFTLDPTSEISHRTEGSSAYVSELLCNMILASCNESTNMLANRIGIPYINQTMQKLKFPNTRISHLLHVGAPLLDSGIDGTSSNTTTAAEMNKLMINIYQKKIASHYSCINMINILENAPEIGYVGHSINTFISRTLPSGTIVGAKAGVLDNDIMETAVVNRDYALTIMFNRLPINIQRIVPRLIAIISRDIFRYHYNE